MNDLAQGLIRTFAIIFLSWSWRSGISSGGGNIRNKTPCHDARERIPLWHLGRLTARTNCTSRSGARPPASPTLPLPCRWRCAIARRCELFAKHMRLSALGFRPPSTQSKPASVRSNSVPRHTDVLGVTRIRKPATTTCLNPDGQKIRCCT